MQNMKQNLLGLAGWLAVTFAAAAIGSVASINAQEFYSQLTRPAWTPPGYVFGPVWTALYTLMAIAAWLVWREKGFRKARTALIIFLLQLGFNAVWSWLFFAWRLGALAFLDTIMLLGLISATMISFQKVKPLAGTLLVPYLLWVGFASWLNYTLWKLNPHLLG
jgi:translocator protein